MSKAAVSCAVEIDVPFFDVDLMEIVWHGNYAKYFEIARCALLEKIDYNYTRMRETGYVWPIIELQVRYAKPAQFGQKIIVNAELVEWEYRMKINYRVFDKASGQRLTRGHTFQVAVNTITNEMCYESPPIIWEKLGMQKP